MKRVRMMVAAMATSALLLPLASDATAEATIGPGGTDQNPPPAAAPSAPSPPGRNVVEALAAAAAAGNVDAMNDLGVLYSLGVQAPPDYPMALYWYQKAIDRGSVEAMNNLATMYLFGVGLSRDYVNAFHWFQRAAEGGNPHGTYSVAVMADIGMGTARHPALARAMYRKAAEAGVTPAMVRISDDYARGPAGSQDLVEAYAWLEVALQAGVPEELQIEVLSRMDALGNRLGAARRDEARVRAVRLAALVKTHVLSAKTESAKPVESVRSNLM
ncbi:MAG TPA: tetratricopeptide repeat protein [Burkholderiaceae bacterium]|nr:tetratricopeptide repeat protein [Burkholderiaceae bacterium]